MKLKANVKYRGNGVFVKAGDVFEVPDEVGNQMKKDFPDSFSDAKAKAKKPASKKSKK